MTISYVLLAIGGGGESNQIGVADYEISVFAPLPKGFDDSFFRFVLQKIPKRRKKRSKKRKKCEKKRKIAFFLIFEK